MDAEETNDGVAAADGPRKATGTLEIAADVPGELVKYSVIEGDTLAEGQPLCTLESMKMQIVLPCPARFAGHRVKALPGRVRTDRDQGELLAKGDLVLEVLPRT
jgi:biotin carboxyl carrier protein